VNPAGIMVGPGGRVDTAGFVASTLSIRNEDFLAGRQLFINDGSAKDILNQGEIRTPSGGSVYLIGSNVSNEGIITTPQGETILAAGATVSLIDSATPGVKVDITGAEGNATNLGTITAEAGRVGIAGVIVRNSGTLNASSVVSAGGRIFLKASQDAYVDGNGRIVTTGTKGGSVEVLGNRVAVTDNASIDASGQTGGGSIKVGGDYQGKNPDIQNANITYFGPDASLKADAAEVGDGGTVIVWADDTTRAYGNISARGGANGGNGGFVETSGHNWLDVAGARVDTRASSGTTGTWLLDPTDVTILSYGGPELYMSSYYGSSSYGGTAGVFGGALYGPATLYWQTIASQLASTNVTVTTAGAQGGLGNITISAPPGLANIPISHTDSGGTWTNPWYGAGYSSSNSLSLLAHGSVDIYAPFGNAGSGAINIMAGWDGASTSAPVLKNFATNASIYIHSGGGIVSKGPVTLQATDTVVVNEAGGSGMMMAGIDMDTGALSIVAHRLLLTGGGIYSNASARIASNGNQSFTVGYGFGAGVYGGGVYLRGAAYGGGPYAGATYGGNAEISQYSATGSQSFTILNGAKVELRGGSNNGLIPAGLWSGECSIGNICSDNHASIRNLGSGGQSFTFSSGGNLNIYGGSVGNDNGAGIENKGTGAQTITGNPAIAIYAGASGGAIATYGGQDVDFGNGASIESELGGQTISAASIYMDGGTANFGGAFIGAPVSTINVQNGVTMIGGAAAAPTAYATYGDTIFKQAAIIGSKDGITLTMNIGSGGLTMTGGPTSQFGGSMAALGSLHGAANITINSSGAITFSGATPGSDRIGSIGSTGGSILLSSTAGTINLGNGFIGSGATGTTELAASSGISQTAAGSIGTGTLTAHTGSGAINLPGANKVGAVYESTAGTFTYNSVVPVSIYSGTASSSVAASSAQSLGFFQSGNLTLNGGSSFTSGADLLVGADGNLTYAGASLNAPGSILLAAYGGMTMAGSLNKPANTLGLVAGGALNVSAGVTGRSLVAVVAGDANITGGYLQTSTGDLELLVGGNLNIGNASSGGYIWAGNGASAAPYPDASIAVMGNLKLNNGAHINAANDVFIDLLGATSTLVLNDGTAGYAPSYILSDIATGVIGTTHLTFLSNSSSSAIVIDGKPTTETVVGGSGFFAVNLSTPAVAGAGLEIQGLAAVPASVVDPCATSPDLCKLPDPTVPPVEAAPLSFDTFLGLNQALADSSGVGGTEGSFGGEENGKDKKDKKDDKKSDESKDGKKNDKPAQKKVAQCSS